MVSVEQLQQRIYELEAENAILDDMSDGILAIDSSKRVVRYNKSFARMWKLPQFNREDVIEISDLKQKMLAAVNPDMLDYHELDSRLLSFDEDLADLLDIQLNNSHILEQNFSREIDTADLKAYVWSFRDVTRQRAIRTELDLKEQFLSRLLNNAPLILFSTDMNGIIQFADGQGSDIFQKEKVNLLGKNIFELSPVIIKEDLKKSLNGQLVRRNNVYSEKYEMYSNVVYSPLLDDALQQIGVIGIIQDVTQAQEAETKRKQQHQMLNRIIYNAPIALIATDTTGKIAFLRGKILNRYKMSQGQDEGKNIFELYEGHPMCDDIRAAIDGKVVNNTHDFTMLDNGGYSELTFAPLRDDNGDIVGMAAVAVDVTDQTLAQIEISRQRQYLDRLLSNAPIVMFASDKDGIITFSRGAELRQFGQKQNEAIGISLLDNDTNHPLQKDVRQALKGLSVHNTHQFGDLYLDMYCTPLLDQDTNITGMIGIGINVTDIKRAQDALNFAEELRKAKEAAEAANIAKTTFIANMSHELRTPLNSIIGFSQFLVKDKSLKPDQQEYIDLISRSSEHLLGLINDILEMSKIESGKTELKETNFDLFELLESVDSIYHTLSAEKGLKYTSEISSAVPRYLYGDRHKLRQILVNLLSNAVKYTDDGDIMLRTWIDEPERPDQLDQFHLFFSVEDTGFGISSEENDLLFEPFIQTSTGQQSAGGSGLGLVITKQFAELMGGDIQIKSQVDKGSRFVVDLYMKNADEIPDTDYGHKKQVIGIAGDKEYKLLVVDDRWENRLMLVRTLESIGFTVREASNGREAIDVWKEWKPDLIWMDMRMPVMNGYEATRNIRKEANNEEVVIIALTASAFEHERRDVLRAGCNDYMSKPFRNEELFAKMERHLDINFIFEENNDDFEDLDETQMSLSMSLSLLDENIREQLKRAVTAYSLEKVTHVVQQIAQKDERLADTIMQLAKDFDFAKIQKVLDD